MATLNALTTSANTGARLGSTTQAWVLTAATLMERGSTMPLNSRSWPTRTTLSSWSGRKIPMVRCLHTPSRPVLEEASMWGKNKYGLGKVVPQYEAFFLPWEGDEIWYKSYQVLTVNRDAYSQRISNVKYFIDEVEIFQYPPETMRISGVTNNECQNVVKTVTISKTTEVETTWNIGRSTMLGITAGITAKIPLIGSGGIEFTGEKTLQFNRGTTMVEALSHSVSVQLTVPPNHSCTVRMEGRKITADIPYTACLSRTYRNGDTQWTSIAGTYDGVQIGEVRAVVDRCEPVANALPCP